MIGGYVRKCITREGCMKHRILVPTLAMALAAPVFAPAAIEAVTAGSPGNQ